MAQWRELHRETIVCDTDIIASTPIHWCKWTRCHRCSHECSSGSGPRLNNPLYISLLYTRFLCLTNILYCFVVTDHSIGRGLTAWVREHWGKLALAGLILLITLTCALGGHRRCRPRGGDTDPASISFGPGSVLRRYKKETLILTWEIFTLLLTSLFEVVYLTVHKNYSPMNPMLRPRTKMPFRAPISTNSSASSLDKENIQFEKTKTAN